MARVKQTVSLIGGLIYLTYMLCFCFLAMVNIMQITGHADRKAGASASQPKGSTPEVEQAVSWGNLSGVSASVSDLMALEKRMTLVLGPSLISIKNYQLLHFLEEGESDPSEAKNACCTFAR